jgi:2-amino-4-hydroxy-6-hydroxymethyldihydropteridine diphosphokinase
VPDCFISVGSNIDKDIYVPASLNALELMFGKLLVSSVYESEPVGFSGDSFYNLVVGFKSSLPISEILQTLRQIESDNGRIRKGQKFSAHTLDLDLILYGDLIVKQGDVQIPRQDIEIYAFVLEPLTEIAPDLQHPLLSISYKKLWENFSKTDLKQKRIQPFWLCR